MRLFTSSTATQTQDVLIIETDQPDRIANHAVKRSFRPLVVDHMPDTQELGRVGNIVIDPDRFNDLPLADLAEHDVRMWITNGANPWQRPLSRWGVLAKRLLDLGVALGVMLVAAPFFALVALGIKATSPGPVFHVQTRLGVDGQWFDMYKFRTMRTDNDASQHLKYFEDFAQGDVEQVDGLYKIVGDPRVTKIGKLLRKYSVDEAPQFINVLRGEMSVVGPRPMLPREIRVLDGHAWQRLRVKPGITGLWQVSGRSRTTFETMIELDVAYWRSWSLRRELTILLRTPGALLRAETA